MKTVDEDFQRQKAVFYSYLLQAGLQQVLWEVTVKK
jgi:hypothetical protein